MLGVVWNSDDGGMECEASDRVGKLLENEARRGLPVVIISWK